MIGIVMACVVACAVVGVWLTTASGQALVARLGWHRLRKGGAPEADRAYLLRACDGDAQQVAERLEAERRRFPDFDDAQLHRRAIRTYMNERGGS